MQEYQPVTQQQQHSHLLQVLCSSLDPQSRHLYLHIKHPIRASKILHNHSFHVSSAPATFQQFCLGDTVEVHIRQSSSLTNVVEC